MNLTVESIKKIKLEQGEVLFVGLPEGAEPKDAMQVQKVMSETMPEGKVIVYIGKMDFKACKVSEKK